MLDSNALRNLSYGVYIITAWDTEQGRPTGCVANSVMQVTSAPATVAVSINHDNHTCACIAQAGRLAVNLLAETTDPALIGRFGFSSGRDTAKLEGVAHRLENGMAVLEDSCGHLAGKVVDKLDTATHTVFLVELEAGEARGGTPMTYRYYHQVVKGKTAKNAPTYLPEAEAAPGGGARWRCTVCGYIHEGEPPFEALPDTWVCPICGVPKSKFEKL